MCTNLVILMQFLCANNHTGLVSAMTMPESLPEPFACRKSDAQLICPAVHFRLYVCVFDLSMNNEMENCLKAALIEASVFLKCTGPL